MDLKETYFVVKYSFVKGPQQYPSHKIGNLTSQKSQKSFEP